MYRRNVRMVERRQDACFTLEPREPLRIAGERVRKDLDRDVAAQLRIARAVDLAHPAAPDEGLDLIDAESLPSMHRGCVAV